MSTPHPHPTPHPSTLSDQEQLELAIRMSMGQDAGPSEPNPDQEKTQETTKPSRGKRKQPPKSIWSQHAAPNDAEIRAIFDKLDVSKSGRITARDLEQIASSMTEETLGIDAQVASAMMDFALAKDQDQYDAKQGVTFEIFKRLVQDL